MKQTSYTYSIVLTPAEEGGFTVTVPSLPGCITEGDSFEEATANAREAIELTLECLKEQGDPIPHELSPSITSAVTVVHAQYA